MALRDRWSWMLVSLLLLGAQRAHAQPLERRVALIDPGAELEAAVRAALEPWHVTIAVVTAPSPGATAPQSNAAARDVAIANDAHAVVWIAEHQGRHALWVYDLQANQAIERELSVAPPFDGEGAAAVAVSVKLLLRHSVVVPESERFGAGAPPTAAPTATATTASTRATPTEPSTRATPAPDAATQMSVVELVGGAGVRLGAMAPGVVEPRFGVGVDWWPSRGGVGFGFAVAGGPAVSLDEGDFDGRLFDVALQLAVSARHAVGTQARVAVGFGFALHVLALDGEVSPTLEPVSSLRTAPALALALQVDWAIAGGVRAGLFLEPSYLLPPERYAVRDDTVLELTHLRMAGGFAVRLALL